MQKFTTLESFITALLLFVFSASVAQDQYIVNHSKFMQKPIQVILVLTT